VYVPVPRPELISSSLEKQNRFASRAVCFYLSISRGFLTASQHTLHIHTLTVPRGGAVRSRTICIGNFLSVRVSNCCCCLFSRWAVFSVALPLSTFNERDPTDAECYLKKKCKEVLVFCVFSSSDPNPKDNFFSALFYHLIFLNVSSSYIAFIERLQLQLVVFVPRNTSNSNGNRIRSHSHRLQ
jgi:hypothetical protein